MRKMQIIVHWMIILTDFKELLKFHHFVINDQYDRIVSDGTGKLSISASKFFPLSSVFLYLFNLGKEHNVNIWKFVNTPLKV